jgi:hypothetical protein
MAGRMIVNLAPYEVIHKTVFYPAGRGISFTSPLGLLLFGSTTHV